MVIKWEVPPKPSSIHHIAGQRRSSKPRGGIPFECFYCLLKNVLLTTEVDSSRHHRHGERRRLHGSS